MIKTRVISMPNAAARRAAMQTVLAARTDLDWAFFDALGPDAPCPLPASPARQIARFGRAVTGPELGCFKSHYQVIRDHAAQDRDTWLLVLEDDIWLDPDFDLTEVIGFCQTHGHDYCRLFAKAHKPAKIIGWLSGFRQVIRYKTDPYGAQAYLISRTAAARFVASVAQIDLPIDDEMGRFWHNGLTPIAVFPFPVVERALPSHIDAGRSQANSARQSMAASPPLFFYRLREKLLKTLANMRLALRDRTGRTP